MKRRGDSQERQVSDNRRAGHGAGAWRYALWATRRREHHDAVVRCVVRRRGIQATTEITTASEPVAQQN
jgi:hypothetical protein